jgi:hypothetical protein
MAHEGKRVLFLCFNKLLAARLEHRIAAKSYKGELVVRHRHLFELIEGTDWEPVVTAAIERDQQTAFDQVLPEHAALVASDRPDARFDALVIDEAQDILTPPNLDGLTDIESDWHRGVAYVGMSRARTRLHVIIHEDCDKKRREREEEWRERVDSDVEMLL